MPKPGLTPKQTRFVSEYLIDLNATQAAIRAGYSLQTARVTGPENLSKPAIKDAIAARTQFQLKKLDLTAERVKERIALLAFQDVRRLFDTKGNLLPVQSLSDEAAYTVGSFEVIKKNAEAGDGHTDTVHKIKILDPVKPLEILAKHFGLLDEHVNVTGELVLRWQS